METGILKKITMDNNLFRMNESVAMGNMQNDFHHKITCVIERYDGEAGFPRVQDYNTDKRNIDAYLLEKQAILDSEGTERSRYTLAGTLIILPVVVVALFPVEKLPFKEYTVFLAILVGLLLYVVVYSIRKMMIKMRIRNLDNECMEEKRYVDAVLEYTPDKNFDK